MARLTILETGREEAAARRRPLGLAALDWLSVAAVVALSTVMSVAATLFSGGIGPEALVPAVVIPLIVATPASVYVFRQRRMLADVNARMLDLLRFDPLTGLLSRRFFLAAAETEAAARGGALLLIDADRFKAINDTYGHPAGDAVLEALAGRFRSVTPRDVLIGRLGGEEFAAFAPGRGPAEGRAMGEAIRQAVRARPVTTDRGEIGCSVSLGLAVLAPGDPLAAAITAADEALYRAKALGRDRLCAAGEAARPERAAS